MSIASKQDGLPIPALQRSGNSRLRRLLPPAELWRWASGKRVSRFIVGESRSRRWLQQLLRKEAAAAKSV